MEFLDSVYYNNTIESYLIASGIIFIGIIILRIFRKAILRRLKIWAATTETTLDDYLVNGFEKFGMPLLNIGIIYFGINYLKLSERIQQIVHNALVVVVTFYVIRLITSSIQIMLESYVKHREGGEEKLKQIKGLMIVIKIVVWATGGVFLFDNLGYNVTAVITGLGIGGIAIALAAQNILGDLFNYFVIFFDRPFEIGDFIDLGGKSGNVEYVGIKTTRIKSISGEQIIVSNTDLTNSRLHNFKRMEKRRILFNLGVTYQTPPDKLRQLPGIIKSVIESEEFAEFDRAHFATYGDFSLNFEIVYFVTNPDFKVFRDVQQSINFKLYDEFAKLGVEFAYPTQTIFLEKT